MGYSIVGIKYTLKKQIESVENSTSHKETVKQNYRALLEKSSWPTSKSLYITINA
jgi:hypothetical protein